MNEVYNEKCRICSHLPVAHGLWRWVQINGDINTDEVVLVENSGCSANPTNWNGNRYCSCSCFMPQDNLKYLKQLYERLTD